MRISLILIIFVATDADKEEEPEAPEHYLIAESILNGYSRDYVPKGKLDPSVTIDFSIELYQLIEVNEPQQYVKLNAWVVERWVDNYLGWDPKDFWNISDVVVPHSRIWIPDTTLYNSLSMDDSSTRRLLNVKVHTLGKYKGGLVELLYPSIYKFSCNLNLRFFPFDLQACVLTFGSWTFDNTLVDYRAHILTEAIGTKNCLDNEGWNILSTGASRLVNKYDCCPNNYTILEYYLHFQRKPLYYVINLIMPTSIISLISVIGFFSSSSINDPREEKITLGITTLLSMSILILMVSDKMPSTSSFIPLIGWFYTSMILLISISTLAASMVIFVQKKGIVGKRPSSATLRRAQFWARLIRMEMPLVMKQAYIQRAKEEKLRKVQKTGIVSMWQRMQTPTRSFDPNKNLSSTTASPIKEPFYTLGMTPLIRVNNDLKQLSGIDERGLPTEPLLDLIDETKGNRSIDNLMKIPVEGSSECDEICGRNLAQLEYDWLAAVIERVFLFTFLFFFFATAIGINTMGFYYWSQAPDLVKSN